VLLITSFFLVSLEHANGSFTISHTYERTVYTKVYIPHLQPGTTDEMSPIFRYCVGVSIQTEPDGSWNETSRYEGVFSVRLEWYNNTLFPYGFGVEFNRSALSIADPRLANSIHLSETIVEPQGGNIWFSQPYEQSFFVIRFDTGRADSFSPFAIDGGGVRLHPQVTFVIWNGTDPDTLSPTNFQGWFHADDFTYIKVKPAATENLSEQAFQNYANVLQLLLILSNIGIIIIIVLMIVLIYMQRKKSQEPARPNKLALIPSALRINLCK